MTLGFYDWLTLLGYFAILLGVAWWVVRQKTSSTKDYFLGGKSATWLVIGTSLFASNIGSEHLVGLAGAGASDGMMMAHFELHAWILLVLGWIMVPFYERSSVYTMPEFLEKRYCSAARWFLSVISLVAYVFTKISVTLFAGGIVFKTLFPEPLFVTIDNFWVGAVGMVLVTGIYTILGGLRAVLYTELFQTAVLIVGSSAVLFIGLHQVGGWSKLKETVQGADHVYGYKISEDGGNTFFKDKNGRDIILPRHDSAKDPMHRNWLRLYELADAEAAAVGLTAKKENGMKNYEAQQNEPAPFEPRTVPAEERKKTDFFNLWRSMFDPAFPWLGLLFGAPIVGMWYWCTDQYIVQRTLAARNQTEARRGTIFAAYLKMFPVFIFIVPGMIAYALAVQGKISSEVLYNPNQAYPVLVREVLPTGLKGIVIGGLLAALMSSLASVFNSCSTLFTMDIYKKLYEGASEQHLVWVGRIATAVMVLLGLAWIPVIQNMPGTLYGYLQSVQSYVAPPIFAVFFLGVFFKRINAYGCMAGLVTGFLLGMLRLGLEIAAQNDSLPLPENVWGILVTGFVKINFSYISVVLTLFCTFVIVTVSLLTAKPDEERLRGLTYHTSTPEQRAETRRSWNTLDIVLSVGIVAVIIAIYVYFTG